MQQMPATDFKVYYSLTAKNQNVLVLELVILVLEDSPGKYLVLVLKGLVLDSITGLRT